MEKHELSKIDFELIDKALKTLLNSGPDPVAAEKVRDLRSMFRNAYTGYLEIDEEVAFASIFLTNKREITDVRSSDGNGCGSYNAFCNTCGGDVPVIWIHAS